MGSIDLSAGSLFAGQFRIVRPLAKGGMGAVYVVEQVSTGRERALKLMHPMLVSDAKSIERFEREAQVGSRIESDHVVEVIAAGVEAAGPTPWICMELLRGETLADRVDKRGPPGRAEAVEIVRQLGHALAAAHRAGIVHRDLKPENVFLAEPRREGVPFTLKVLDFGVATLANELQGPKTTQGVGSPLWMAPEQTNVGKVVLATDVWALGLVVFYLLTGQSYWRTVRTLGSTITALLVEIMVEALEPASVRAAEVAPGVALPAGFDAWFARCVVRDPTARFPDAGAAIPPLLSLLTATGLEAFGATAPAPTPAPVHSGVPAATMAPVARPPRRVWPWVALGIFGVGGACAALVLYDFAVGVREGLEEVQSSGVLEGRVRDPETGAEVHLGPDGLQVTAPEGRLVTVGSQGVEVTGGDLEVAVGSVPAGVEAAAEAEAVAAAETATEAATETETEAATETETEAATETETEAATETETEAATEAETERPLRPRLGGRVIRAIAGARARSTVTPEQSAHFQGEVVRRCRTNLEGVAPERFVVRVDGSRISVEPVVTREQDWFARCIRVIAREQSAAVGTYVFTAP